MLRRSTSKVFFLMLSIIILVSFGFAQQTIKIGVVNSREVLEKSAEGKSAMEQLQKKDSSNQSKLAKMDEDIRNLETKLTTQRMTLSNEAIIQLNSDLEKKRTDRKRFAEDSYREMQDFTSRLFAKIQGELLPIIEGIGKDMNLDVIFDLQNSGAIYFNPAIDLTSEVIKRYDASKTTKK
ncbi:MAG: OmpH family outer membrane protein [Candidatus Aminicenantes bacterium]|nr:OmpH family outer membrane protein [Candidatus Aminicenantes bacterium]